MALFGKHLHFRDRCTRGATKEDNISGNYMFMRRCQYYMGNNILCHFRTCHYYIYHLWVHFCCWYISADFFRNKTIQSSPLCLFLYDPMESHSDAVEFRRFCRIRCSNDLVIFSAILFVDVSKYQKSLMVALHIYNFPGYLPLF